MSKADELRKRLEDPSWWQPLVSEVGGFVEKTVGDAAPDGTMDGAAGEEVQLELLRKVMTIQFGCLMALAAAAGDKKRLRFHRGAASRMAGEFHQVIDDVEEGAAACRGMGDRDRIDAIMEHRREAVERRERGGS